MFVCLAPQLRSDILPFLGYVDIPGIYILWHHIPMGDHLQRMEYVTVPVWINQGLLLGIGLFLMLHALTNIGSNIGERGSGVFWTTAGSVSRTWVPDGCTTLLNAGPANVTRTSTNSTFTVLPLPSYVACSR